MQGDRSQITGRDRPVRALRNAGNGIRTIGRRGYQYCGAGAGIQRGIDENQPVIVLSRFRRLARI